MMKLASPLRRFMAYILDGIGISIIYGICVTLIGLPLLFANHAVTYLLDSTKWMSMLVGGTYIIYALILLGAVFMIQCIFWSKGTTLGKAILKMKVVDKQTNQPIGFWKMLLRELIIKQISGICFGLGYLWMLFDRDNQTWHDKILNTIVLQA